MSPQGVDACAVIPLVPGVSHLTEILLPVEGPIIIPLPTFQVNVYPLILPVDVIETVTGVPTHTGDGKDVCMGGIPAVNVKSGEEGLSQNPLEAITLAVTGPLAEKV